MTIQSKGSCGACKTNKLHDQLSVIGVGVATDEGMAGSTQYDFLQCNDCGSILVRYKDKGLGKGGPFFKRLTGGLF
ncbi:MAG: hypothetical protein V7695_23790 [Sulfitobacter sp.]